MNSVKGNYVYAELVELLGLTYAQITDRVDELIEQEYLSINESMTIDVGQKGIDMLAEKRFLDISIFDIYDEREIYVEKISNRLDVNDIYIPKNFNKKFSGY